MGRELHGLNLHQPFIMKITLMMMVVLFIMVMVVMVMVRGKFFWAGNCMASCYVNLFGHEDYANNDGCVNHNGYKDGGWASFLGRELHGHELRQPLIMKILKWLCLWLWLCY